VLQRVVAKAARGAAHCEEQAGERDVLRRGAKGGGGVEGLRGRGRKGPWEWREKGKLEER
jgi:hypothetical protein